MQLTVIIVSYNVRAFLEKCLVSVGQAMEGIDGEVIVVDNASSDDSVEIVSQKFPDIRLIANQDNLGFAKANNIAIKQARGKYVLLLNPDTVVSEDTFSKCMSFMDDHPEAAAVGVKMVDGTGTWLPESKRGLPTPVSAFFKLSGLNTLFPHSNLFNGYYLGGLDRNETNPVDVLTGAFMFMRKEALDHVGLLDEDYFMYGEDIDLSYRLLKAGYKNYYLPGTSIIHYKGESTQRDSLAYVKRFYGAMRIFVQKHHSGFKGTALSVFIMLGIVVKSVMSLLVRVVRNLLAPILDCVLIVLSLMLVKKGWASWYFEDVEHFTSYFETVNIPVYASIWLLALALFGVYDRGGSAKKVLGAIVFGTLAILLVYALMADGFRSSRAVIIMTSVVLSALLTMRIAVFHALTPKSRHRRVIVAGYPDESARIMELLNRVHSSVAVIGSVSVGGKRQQSDIGRLSELDQIIRAYQIDEVIFSARDLSFGEISKQMTRLGSVVRYKIASERSNQLIGSDSKSVSGDSYVTEIDFAITNTLHRRNKRIFDLLVSLAFIVGLPFWLFSRRYRTLIKQVPGVIQGRLTWVGYDNADDALQELPRLRPAVMSVADPSLRLALGPEELHMINYLYAREYRIWRDVEIVFKGIANR